MKNDFNLEKYLSEGIKNIIKDAVKATLKNPKQSAFFLKYASSAKKAEKSRAAAAQNGEHIPPLLIASITEKCNLRCAGCYAHANAPQCGQDELDAAQWERIFSEAKGLGVAVILLAGGEPFMRPEVIAAAAKHPEILFPIFTNGTAITKKDYLTLNTYRNLLPIISLEGGEAMTDARRGPGVYSSLMAAMRELDRIGVLFGASITVTSENIEYTTSEAFIDDLCRKGCKIVFYVEYVPVDSEELALSDAKRELLEARIAALRKKEMLFVSFPGDEKESGGCLAAGRGFFHIAPNGNAEPCPFSPYSDTNLRAIPLKEALNSPLFKKLAGGDILSMEHKGGCVLFEQKDIVSKLV